MVSDSAAPAVAAEPESTGLSSWVPGVRALRSYHRSWFRFDLVAGVVLAAILVPQGMAYAELAGLPPVTGLYTTIACLVGYALMGPSRVLVLGPDSSVSPLIFAAIFPLVAVTDDPSKAIALAGMMAVLVGVILIGLGVGKLGFVADLLSKEVQVGYMNGLAITIIVGQLPKLFGFSTDADGFIEEVQTFFSGLDERNSTALAVGVGSVGRSPPAPSRHTRDTRRTGRGRRRHRGDRTVRSRHLDGRCAPAGPAAPGAAVDDVGRRGADARRGGRNHARLAHRHDRHLDGFAARRGDEVVPNQEMIGIGTANVAAGFFQGFAVSTSSSRTAVAESTGAKSQLTGLVGALVVALLLLFFSTLLADLPQTALAAVVIGAALSLADIKALRHYWNVRTSSFVLSLVATGGVVFFGVLQGILIAVVLSILLFFKRSWWPHGEVLGHVEGEGWHSLR